MVVMVLLRMMLHKEKKLFIVTYCYIWKKKIMFQLNAYFWSLKEDLKLLSVLWTADWHISRSKDLKLTLKKNAKCELFTLHFTRWLKQAVTKCGDVEPEHL